MCYCTTTPSILTSAVPLQRPQLAKPPPFPVSPNRPRGHRTPSMLPLLSCLKLPTPYLPALTCHSSRPSHLPTGLLRARLGLSPHWVPPRAKHRAGRLGTELRGTANPHKAPDGGPLPAVPAHPVPGIQCGGRTESHGRDGKYSWYCSKATVCGCGRKQRGVWEMGRRG